MFINTIDSAYFIFPKQIFNRKATYFFQDKLDRCYARLKFA